MKSLYALLPLVLLTSSCIKERLKGEGDIISETRSVSYFHTVESDGDNRVSVVRDSVYKVIVTGYENLVPEFRTSVSNGKLHLEYDDDFYVRNDNIQIEVHAPVIENVRIEGSGRIEVRSGFTGGRFEGHIDGSGSIEVQGGSFGVMVADINGSGDIRCDQAICDTAYADISGSGDIDVNVSEYLDARISGSGTIRYRGNPVVKSNISGSGTVKKF